MNGTSGTSGTSNIGSMRRRDIRTLKRAASGAGNADAMQLLLQRSVRFGHKRLALIRCVQAEKMGIAVEPAILAYCRRIADGMAPDALRKILLQAGQSSRGTGTTAY